VKLPVKGRETVPWIAPNEIPAVKAALSAWRGLRRDRAQAAARRAFVDACAEDCLPALAEGAAMAAARALEELATAEARLRKGRENKFSGSRKKPLDSKTHLL